MPTKRCELCQQMRPIEDIDICCKRCEETELDLLIGCYAYIHCYENDYCPSREIIKHLDPVRGNKVTTNFIKAWVRKNWLDINDVDSVRVPTAIKDEIKENGFAISQAVHAALMKQRNQRPQFAPQVKRTLTEEKPNTRLGMAYMDKMKDKKSGR